MRPVRAWLLALLLAAPLLGGAAPQLTPVTLSAQPGTQLEKTAKILVARELAEARRAGDTPLVLVGAATLGQGANDRPAVLVQLQSSRECGSAGCSTSIYHWRQGAWRRVLDGVAGNLAVSSQHTRGMADITSDGVRYVWTGTRYHDPRPAPKVGLRPRTPRG